MDFNIVLYILLIVFGVTIILLLFKILFRRSESINYKQYQQTYSLDDDFDINAKLKEYLSSGNKIEAIKFISEKKNIGLKEAKDFVSEFELNFSKYEEVNQIISKQGDFSSDEKLRHAVNQLLLKNHKIHAIKLVLDSKRIGLKEAKDYVETLEKKLRDKK